MTATLAPFPRFTGEARAAMAQYAAHAPGARLLSETLWGKDAPAPEGQVTLAEMDLAGCRVRFSDSPAVHAFGFTPSLSLFLTVTDRAAFDAVHAGLAAGGDELMPPGNYGFSERFAWINDRLKVSWQINLEPNEGA